MKTTKEKPVGLTKDAGWQFGLRKTFPYGQQYVWDFMFSDKGLKIWLGELNQELEIKKAYITQDGIEGLVNVFTPYSHIRLTWKKKNWAHASAVQVRVMGNADKTTVSFHQDNLSDSKQRAEMKSYWNQKMTEIEQALTTK